MALASEALDRGSPTQQGRHTKKHLEDRHPGHRVSVSQQLCGQHHSRASHAGPARGHTHGSHHIEAGWTGWTGRTCVALQCCMVRRATGSLHRARQAVYQPLNFNHSNLDASVALSLFIGLQSLRTTASCAVGQCWRVFATRARGCV
jgi:hypothetical protein